jgi:hypothetical protein
MSIFKFNPFNSSPNKPPIDTDQIQSGDGILRNLVRGALDRHKVKHEFSSMGPFYAVVLGVQDSPTAASLTSDKRHIESNASAESNNRVKIYAWVDAVDPLPLPDNYATEYPSGGGEVDQSLDLVRMRTLFEAENEDTPKPQLGELVKVDWTMKNGNNIEDWGNPVYLGPARRPKPIIVPLSKKQKSPKDAHSDASQPTGLANFDDNGNPTDEITHFDAPINWSNMILTSGKLRIRVPGITHKQNEIYVDKKIDYTSIKTYDVIPYSSDSAELSPLPNSNVQYRKNNIVFYLPQSITTTQKKVTKLFVIRESGDWYTRPYGNLYSDPTMHYTISMNSKDDGSSPDTELDKICTIRVNVPYGLNINKDDIISSNSIGCMISAPFDGTVYLNDTDRWNPSLSRTQIEQSSEFEQFKARYSTWIATKALPDDTKPFILGPWGTPGLRTGPNSDQTLPADELTNQHFWEGRLIWSKWGHYFLPTLEQAEALFELISNTMNTPPRSAYSWGFSTPTWYKHELTWNFPAVGGGDPLFPSSHFIKKEKFNYVTKAAFPWGKVGATFGNHAGTYQRWWEEKISSRYKSEYNGVVSYCRWGQNGSAFLEYYVLGRSAGLGQMESWYLAIATASETYSKSFGGVGLGPSFVPSLNDAKMNTLLKMGQKRWFRAIAHNSDFNLQEYVPGTKYVSSSKFASQVTSE